MGLLNFGQAQNIAQPKPKKKPSAASVSKSAQKKPASERRRPLEDQIVYGDELFESSRKKEKEIVIAFYPFTPNNLRISKDGKFIIEYIPTVGARINPEPNSEQELLPEIKQSFNLYYYPDASINFDPDKNPPYIINEDKCVAIKDFSSLEEIEAKVIELVRNEYLEERSKKLEDLREEERIAKIERDKLEAEEDAKEELEKEGEESENELEQGEPTQFTDNSNSKINNAAQEENKEGEISEEKKQENVGEGDSSKEESKPRNLFFSQIK